METRRVEAREAEKADAVDDKQAVRLLILFLSWPGGRMRCRRLDTLSAAARGL